MKEKGKSVLIDFCAVPRRAFGDKRLQARHLRVLGSICKAVDNATGLSLITQTRIGELCGRRRTKVASVTAELEAWGYLRKIERGRQSTGLSRGRFRTFVYQVIYRDPSGGNMGRDPSGGDKALTPPGGTDSYLYKPDLSISSDLLEVGRFASLPEGGSAPSPAQQGKKLDALEEGWREADRLGVDRETWNRFAKAHTAAKAVATSFKLVAVEQEARKLKDTKSRFQFMAEEYEKLARKAA
jgi:hypothetical protein